ncbi:FtsX-like permease family protein [Lactococcus fujiensis]|nr:FtsX-like permease family protein [Lactococcus fujiensis]
MKKRPPKKLNKDIRKSITSSIGRFLSIFSLMALGVFAFIGLKVSGPDMRETANRFYQTHQLADLTVVSNLGLDESDQKLIESANGIKKVEFGYFQDVPLGNSETAIRLFNTPKVLSTYQLISGKMPSQSNEIALDYLLKDKYKISQTVNLNENTDHESSILKNHTFKIVGFVKSSEYVDKNSFGQTTIGTGQLNGYGVTTASAFRSNVKMIARISYGSLVNLSPYNQTYKDKVTAYQIAMQDLLKSQPEKRLAALKKGPEQKLAQAQNELNQKNVSLNQQQNELNLQKAQLKQAQAAGLAVDPTQIHILDTFQKKIDDGRSQIQIAQEKVNLQRKELNQLTAPVYTVSDRNSADPGYQIFIDNSTRIDTLSNIFPVVLFAIAALVSLTTMTRFVEEERSNLGLLKALGYTNRQIRKKFMVYGFVSAFAGATVGTVLGHWVLPLVVFKAYTASSTFTDLALTFSWQWTVVAFAISILCTVFPAYLTSKEVLRSQPSDLFVAKAPKAGSRILLERVNFIWRRMSFTYKVTARNLFRYKKRMLMTIVGIAGCTALLVMGFGIRDSISGLSSRQFNDILHYDMIAIQDKNITAADQAKVNSLMGEQEVKKHLGIHFEQFSTLVGTVETKQTVQLIVPSDEHNFSSFVSLQNRTTKKGLALTNHGAVISEKFAKLLNAKVGDTIKLADENNKTVSIKVTGITEMYMGHYLFMNRAAYEQALHQSFKSNAQLIGLRNNSDANVQDFAAKLMKNNGILTVSQNNDLKTTINSFLYGINSVMFVLIGCAILLAVVVIYNLTNINVSERIRELSTIKVLGFYDHEVTLYIYRETILLSFLGIVGGFALGAYLHHVIITMLPTDMVMFSPGLTMTNLILSALITLATTLLLSIMVHIKLKNVDMLGALKSVD